MADDDTVFCAACGAVHESATERIRRLEEERELAEKDLRGKRTRIKRLLADRDKALRDSKHYDEAVEVALHWQATCAPGAREPTNMQRIEPTIARLAHYTKTDLKRAIDGYAARPFIVNRRRVAHGSKDDWYADLELIMRDAKHVDAGLRMVEHEEQFEQVVAAPEAEPAQMPLADDVGKLSPVGEKALDYARFGWHVFPVVPGDKNPSVRGGLLAATTDRDRIVNFWREHPNHNVAIRCGAESKIIVLDVDDRHDGDESLRALEARFGELPTTLSIKTPGGGTHFYFDHPGQEIRNSASMLGQGLDIRGDGGYVLAPPSVNGTGKTYEVDEYARLAPMPMWLRKEIASRQLAVDQAVAKNDWAAMFDGVAPGARNDLTTKVVGRLVHDSPAMRGGYLLGVVQALNQTYCKPPLPAREVDRIVNSVLRMHSRPR